MWNLGLRRPGSLVKIPTMTIAYAAELSGVGLKPTWGFTPGYNNAAPLALECGNSGNGGRSSSGMVYTQRPCVDGVGDTPRVPFAITEVDVPSLTGTIRRTAPKPRISQMKKGRHVAGVGTTFCTAQ